MKTRFCTVSVLVLCLGAATVAAQKISTKDFSGWMDDYESLVYIEDRNAFLFYNEDKRGKYDKVMLQSVSVYGNNAKAQGKVATEATDYLTAEVRRILKQKGIMATEPGPRVLRYNMAITAVEKSKEDLKAHNLIPVSALFRGAKAATGNLNTYIDAMFEAEMVDSVTGERVMATVRRGIGETEKKSGDDLTFADVKPTLDEWAAAYSKTLDEVLARDK